ncbi:class B sortase [uncultured Eubacterium sp.]|uniref:class B sortase n=1 Tax=uncultured Eubacterium sp. TaxID=165185 RepID=UPI002625C41B|nr:class B sortase [uncultured Eubacterium sp.]
MDNDNKKSNSRTRKVIVILAVILIVVGVGITMFQIISTQTAKEKDEELTSTTTTQQATAPEPTVANKIDFDSLEKKNDEIYAWIKVPGTKVNYPIVQSRTDDTFYLKHSATDKKYSSSGAVYTQSVNKRDFTDRVTLIYGHNGYGDTYFTTLHRFEKQDFFEKHTKFVIYTPTEKLTYRIVSAFKYDDRHIMNSFDFHDNNIFKEFIDMIQNPTSANKNVAKVLDKEITINDNIVVLSTCFTGQKSNRYLVCGVLIKNEKTN